MTDLTSRDWQAQYKDTLHAAYMGELRKTYHKKRRKPRDGAPFKWSRNVQNLKRRPVVAARLKKLRRYVKRAWNGYSFGKIAAKNKSENNR